MYNELEEIDGVRYATVEVGNMGFMDPREHQNTYWDSGDSSTTGHHQDHWLGRIHEVIELGSLNWFSFHDTFQKPH